MIPRDMIEMINHRFGELVEQECSDLYERTFVVNEYECTRNFGVPWAEAIYQKSAGGSNQEEIDSCIRSLIDQMKAKYAERQKNPSYVQISEILKKQDSVQIKARVDITDLTFQFTSYVSKLVDEVEQTFQCRAGNINYVHQMVWWINSQLYQFKMSKSANTITYQVYSDRNGSEIHVDLFDVFGLVPEDDIHHVIKTKPCEIPAEKGDENIFSDIPVEKPKTLSDRSYEVLRKAVYVSNYTGGEITRRCLESLHDKPGQAFATVKHLLTQGYLQHSRQKHIYNITDKAKKEVGSSVDSVEINWKAYVSKVLYENNMNPKAINVLLRFLNEEVVSLKIVRETYRQMYAALNTLLVEKSDKSIILSKWGRHVIDQLKLQKNKEESK